MAASLSFLLTSLSILLFFLEGSVADFKISCNSVTPVQVHEILFVIQSQPQPYHAALATKLKQQYVAGLREEGFVTDNVKILLTHAEQDMEKSWAVFPLLKALAERSDIAIKKWIFIVEDQTQILSFKLLLEKLSGHNPCEPHLIGRGLYDREPAIIHHFAFVNELSSFAFPDFAAGWLLSIGMLERIITKLSAERLQPGFTIDPQHEIAKYVYDKFDQRAMETADWLCAGDKAADATSHPCVTSFSKEIAQCEDTVASKNVFFAVKTTEMFHKSRIPILMETWGRDLVADGNMVLYSNVTDTSIPTVDCGVPNTERGHCGKLYAIMKSAIARMTEEKQSWLVVTDDDTLMSVSRLLRLLSCYDNSEPVAVGEVYGYGANTGHGYGYLTGGGGFVLSLPAVVKLVEAADGGVCGCQADDSPDDMFLGMCLQSLHIPIAHRPEFHQARPGEYSVGYLARQTPISFHRHAFHFPLQSYREYLSDSHHNRLDDEL